MLKVVRSMKELEFSKLMAVYEEGNLENGRNRWRLEPECRQIMLAEQDFHSYLCQVFFRTKDAVYLVWQEGDEYVSALRLEPYRDGLLLAALETAPRQRRKGYAGLLVRSALEQYAGVKVYSHVDKKNTASRRTHESCGFRKVLDHAVYADGSVLHSSVTYCHE